MVNRDRMQGRIILQWLKMQEKQLSMKATALEQKFDKELDGQYKESCESVLKIADICMNEVIDYYANTKCHEYAHILEILQ